MLERNWEDALPSLISSNSHLEEQLKRAHWYLVDIPLELWWEIGKVPVVGFVLRVPQQAVEPHHVGVGRAKAKAPVDLQPALCV